MYSSARVWNDPSYVIDREVVTERDGEFCHYCGIPLPQDTPVRPPYRDIREARGVLDHKVPRWAGGSDDVSNLVLACRICDSCKGTLPYETFKSLIVLYGPPKDWSRRLRRIFRENIGGLMGQRRWFMP
jgi:5-methylcytosine-specific restriction endonuclease McrA